MIIQGTPEWRAVRLGKVTASRVADVIARTKSGWGASRANYMAELIAERLTGEPSIGFTNTAMQWGTDQEPEARAAYAFRNDADVQEIGFVDHPVIAMSGASPDGLVGNDGMAEFKCPNTATHIETLLGQNISDKYVVQMMWQMACCKRQWCDFVSFDPRLPESMRLYVKRCHFDTKRVAELETEISKFLDELDAKTNALMTQFKVAA